MIQKAVVTKILSDRTAEIMVQRQSACASDCSSCKGCLSESTCVKAIAVNAVGAKEGQQVDVEAASGPILRAAFVVFLLPVLLLFVFYALAAWLLPIPMAAPLAALLGFVSGMAIAIRYNRYVREKKPIGFTIVSK